MKVYSLVSAITFACISFSAYASDFFNTEPTDKLFNLGLRLGVNASNKTFSHDYFREWNVNSWGTGFDAGVIFNINLRQYLTIQPGFFFESRSGHYSYIQSYINPAGEEDYFTQLGKSRAYYFNIPIMASIRFNLASSLKWLVEAGPYFQLKLHASDNEKIEVLTQSSSGDLTEGLASTKSVDAGLKFGTGLLISDHYSFSIHYLAGGRDVWKAPYNGGRNKAWTFTLGYDF
ncbi:MAG: PorT family protein [Muribaculaceae bacterium]|nr:PorT family protein [Muribaculaceae bacterium]